MNNRIIILLIFIIYAFPTIAKDIETSDLKLSREGEMVVLSFSAYIPEKTVRPNYRLLITPQLYNKNGTAVMKLFTVTGNKMERREKQKRRLDKNNAVHDVNTSNGSTMLYTASVPYEKWMENTLSLRLLIEEAGCCSTEYLGAMAVIGSIDLPLPYEPFIPEVIALPSEVTQKKTDYPFLRLVDKDGFGDRSISARFKVASSELDFSFSSNTTNVNKIKDGIHLINNNPRTRLEKITIVGFASPEGDRQLNMRLSEDRAKALSLHLQQTINIPEHIFEIQSKGEDWDGLLELVKKSDMRYKEEIINIITNTPAEKRDEQLKQLAGGRPYRSIYDILYPQLRDACYINIWYSEEADKPAEIINNAIGLITTSHYNEALESLHSVEHDSRSWNVIGSCFLLQGDYANARIWLQKAADAGDKDAEKNLSLIK